MVKPLPSLNLVLLVAVVLLASTACESSEPSEGTRDVEEVPVGDPDLKYLRSKDLLEASMGPSHTVERVEVARPVSGSRGDEPPTRPFVDPSTLIDVSLESSDGIAGLSVVFQVWDSEEDASKYFEIIESDASEYSEKVQSSSPGLFHAADVFLLPDVSAPHFCMLSEISGQCSALVGRTVVGSSGAFVSETDDPLDTLGDLLKSALQHLDASFASN